MSEPCPDPADSEVLDPSPPWRLLLRAIGNHDAPGFRRAVDYIKAIHPDEAERVVLANELGAIVTDVLIKALEGE